MMLRSPIKYFKQFNNLIDLYQHTAILVLLVIKFSDLISDEDLAFNLVVNLTILAASYRGLFALRILEPVRYLVIMILQAFIDMTGFAVISIVAIFTFGSAFRNSTKTTEQRDEALGRPSLQWGAMFEYFFGNWDEPFELNYVQATLHYINAVFIALVMANLLIGIVSQTFANFYEQRELIDFKEMISVLLEFGELASYFTKNEEEPIWGKHLCFVVKKEAEGEDEEQVLEEIRKLDEKSDQILEMAEESRLRDSRLEERIEKIEKALKDLIKN